MLRWRSYRRDIGPVRTKDRQVRSSSGDLQLSQEEQCRHVIPDRVDGDFIDRKCTECGKTCGEMFNDLKDIDPTTKVSQQPYGKSTLYCNACQMYVVPTSYAGETDICPYHQRVSYSEDGEVDFMYDEFDQEGN